MKWKVVEVGVFRPPGYVIPTNTLIEEEDGHRNHWATWYSIVLIIKSLEKEN